jgi:hypothetical protein
MTQVGDWRKRAKKVNEKAKLVVAWIVSVYHFFWTTWKFDFGTIGQLPFSYRFGRNCSKYLKTTKQYINSLESYMVIGTFFWKGPKKMQQWNKTVQSNCSEELNLNRGLKCKMRKCRPSERLHKLRKFALCSFMKVSTYWRLILNCSLTTATFGVVVSWNSTFPINEFVM